MFKEIKWNWILNENQNKKKKTMGPIFQEDAKQNKEKKKKKKVTGKTIILPILITSRINGLLG